MFKKALDFARALLGVADTTGNTELRTRRDQLIVKALIPPSSFTKRGPGVRAQLRSALLKMTPEQRELAFDRGWARKSDLRKEVRS